MTFELDDVGAREIDEQARRGGVPLGTTPEPGAFSGTMSAAGEGLARGLIGKPALMAGDAATPLLRVFARPVDQLFGTTLEGWLQDQRRKNYDALDQWKPDPVTTGFAGQVVNSLFDVGGSAMLFGPAPTALFSGYAKRQEDIGKGIDPGTATVTGAVDAAGTYAGLRMPLAMGQVAVGTGAPAAARNVAAGAAVSVASGTAETLLMKDVLERAGYAAHAGALQPFDATSLASQALLGGLFSGAAHAVEARAGSSKAQAAVDAALTIGAARHAALDTAPGVPTTPRANAAHADALTTAADALMRNTDVDVSGRLDGTEFVRRASPARDAAAAELEGHVGDLLAPLKNETDMRRAAQLTPAEQAREDRFEASPENLAMLRTEIAKTKNPANRKLLEDELAKQESASQQAAAMAADTRTPAQKDYGRFLSEFALDEPTARRLSEDTRTQTAMPPGFEHLSTEPSAIEGVGMYSRTPFAAGDDIGPMSLGDQRTPLGRYVNHSDDPSASVVVQPNGDLRMTALRAVPASEELTISYRQAAEANGAQPVGAQEVAMQSQEPAVMAAMAAAQTRPDMLVALEDGSQLPARDVMRRAHELRQEAQRESSAFEAAVNCFLRSGS